jgi:hypothetical protein
MKKILFILLAGFTVSAVQSQEISDALRYAQDNLQGTARFSAMSGAFGALGGDLSSIQVNPAGSAVFSATQLGVTLSSLNLKNKSDYFGTLSSQNNTAFDLNQAGAVLVFNNHDEKTGWKKFLLAVDYENANNLDNSLFSYGNNPTHSVADYFLSYANPNPTIGQGGILLSTLDNYYYEDLNYADQQAALGYQANIIVPDNPNDPNNNTYHSNVPAGGNYYHENYIESTGYNGKLAFNASAAYQDRFFFGLSINSHFTDYIKNSSFYEENTNSPDTGVGNLVFNNDLHTYGNGFSFQLGAIAKITPAFRAGLAYQSPTWYTLNDELRQTTDSQGFFTPAAEPALSYAYSDSDITIAYAPYKLQTPGKWTGSLAYVFNKSGLISFDFGVKDYSKTRFRSDNSFDPLNNSIDNTLDFATEFRIGAEKRIKQWSLRAGFRNEQSPYKNKEVMGDLTGFSGGFGYNFGFTKIDLSYSYAERKSQQGFFSQGFTDGPKIKTQSNNVALTLLFDL